MRVVVVGLGLMGSQMACEYALGGHEVGGIARRPDDALARIDRALALAADHGLVGDADATAARRRIAVGVEAPPGADLVVESIVEDLSAKAEVLAPLARAHPDATIATNTSSLSIDAIGAAAGAPARTVGAHYWNPPLLMPLVELVAGPRSDRARVEALAGVLRGLGKRPVIVERDVPGFVWNRLQLALLREALWIAENGVAAPETVDEIVRDGLARRWRHTGPFETAALGGVETFERVAANLFAELSRADRADGLGRFVPREAARLAALRERRDRALAAELLRERRPGEEAGR